MSDRYDQLSPRDLIVTLRSLPRRFDGVHSTATRTPELAARIDAPGPEGSSLSEIVNHASRTTSILGRAIDVIVTTTTPVIARGVLDHDDRTATDGAPMTVKNAIGLLSDEAVTIADQLDNVPADDWNRTAAITGGGSTTLVEVARELVRSVVELLRSAEHQAEWMQSQ